MSIQRRPSLMGALLWIALGLAFLLYNFRVVHDLSFLYAKYWPVLLILLGLGKIIEYALKKDAIAVRFGELALLVFVLLIGWAIIRLSEGNVVRFIHELPNQIRALSIQPEFFWGESHTYSDEAVYPLESHKTIRVENSNGLISISPGKDSEIRVKLKKVIYCEEPRAKSIADEIRLETASDSGSVGSIFVIRTNRNDLSSRDYRFSTDLEILVPKNLQLQIKNAFGEIRVARLDGSFDLSTTHKSIDLQDCSGQFNISAKYSECRLVNLVGNVKLEARGKVHIENIKGDVEITNEYSPLEIYSIDGKLSVTSAGSNLAIGGVTKPVVIDGRGSQIRVEKLKDSLKINASYKGVDISDIASDVTLETRYAAISIKNVKGKVYISSDSDRIHADEIDGGFTLRARGSWIGVNTISGPLDIQTSFKPVFVTNFADSCTIENSYANISISTKTLGKGNITLKNRAGMIDVHMPQDAAFEIDAIARNGKITSDYPELKPIRNYGNGVLKSRLKAGGPKILLETENSSIDIHNAPRNTAEPGQDGPVSQNGDGETEAVL
jgi:DUF4097 and DUF4098 domain-containing protein YvlB